jgi:hypothetical protein
MNNHLKATFLNKPVRVFTCDINDSAKAIVRYFKGSKGSVLKTAHRDNIILSNALGFQFYSDDGCTVFPSEQHYYASVESLEGFMRLLAMSKKRIGEDISSLGDLNLRQIVNPKVLSLKSEIRVS